MLKIELPAVSSSDEEGMRIDLTDLDWRELFSLNDVDGGIRTTARLDREIIQVVRYHQLTHSLLFFCYPGVGPSCGGRRYLSKNW